MLYYVKSPEYLSIFGILYFSVSYISLTLFPIKFSICFNNARLRDLFSYRECIIQIGRNTFISWTLLIKMIQNNPDGKCKQEKFGVLSHYQNPQV